MRFRESKEVRVQKITDRIERYIHLYNNSIPEERPKIERDIRGEAVEYYQLTGKRYVAKQTFRH